MNHHLVLVLDLAGAVLNFHLTVILLPMEVSRFSVPMITDAVVVFKVP